MTAKKYNEEFTPEIESILTSRRLVELEFRPVEGCFDAHHLQKIHFKMTQDFPHYLNAKNIHPGEFRSYSKETPIWQKERNTFGKNYDVLYSEMNSETISYIHTQLSSISPEQLRKMDLEHAATAIADIYSKLDYCHPFHDGNSRTLRKFIQQMAEEAGLDLQWHILGSEDLYRGRDISLHQVALSLKKGGIRHYTHQKTYDYINDGHKNLAMLVKEALRPERAKYFENLSRNSALKKCPELAVAYNVMDKHIKDACAHYKNDSIKKDRFIRKIRTQIQNKLNKGEEPVDLI